MRGHRIEARVPCPEILPSLLQLGGTNPRGDRIAFTNSYPTWNGKPWLPVAGELHFSRLPREAWRAALLTMLAGGVDIVSTYVFWIHHEEEEGVFEWSGCRDLRAFVETCSSVGILAIVRVGPFCHGEVRNGGIPDWLYGRPFPLRCNDDRYLFYVRRLYREIGCQLRGLLFKDGGPVIGIQLENEHMHAGAPWETIPRLAQEWVPAGSDGAEHLRTLKRIALESGMDAPIFTCTAWGGASVPEGEVLPLYGGYAFCPWNVTEASPDHEPTREYIFHDYRKPARRDEQFDPPYDPLAYPFACCEIGGGMQSWYGYRFRVPAESVEAMAVVKLAGGCSLLGYYMYHGGSNPTGTRGFLNEHMVPRISYDFQAPVGEFGQVRDSYRRLRRVHLFCRHFANELAPAEPVLPRGAEDLDPRDDRTLRFAVRVRNNSGFLFLSNYQDHAAMRDHGHVRIQIDLESGPIRFPYRGGFTVKRGTCAIFPFNLDLGGVRLLSATAQPLGRLTLEDGEHFFFFAHEGIPPEFCLAKAGELAVEKPHPGLADGITLSTGGRRVVIHTLTELQSLGCSILDLWGRSRVIITEAAVFANEGALHLRSNRPDPIDVWIFPAPERTPAIRGATLDPGTEGVVARYRVTMPADAPEVVVKRWGETDAEIAVPASAFHGAQEILLSIEYEGDVGSAFINGELVADNFASGDPWEIGLHRFLPSIVEKGMYLHVTPSRRGAFVAWKSGMAFQQQLRGAPVARIGSIEARAVREAILEER